MSLEQLLRFLANVNSRMSSSSSTCRLSLTFVHPTQAIKIFGNVSTPFGTLAISDLSVKNYENRPGGTPLSEGGGVKRKRGSQI